MNKREAYASKVLVPPTHIHNDQQEMGKVLSPRCPDNYFPVSVFFMPWWIGNNGQEFPYERHAVNCLHDKYIISTFEAKEKYGLTKFEKV